MFFAIFQIIQCAFLILNVFHCFTRYSRSYSVHFSFPRFSVFFAIFQVLQCAFLFFHVFLGFSFCHILGRTGCNSHFSNFLVYSSKSKSYSVHFSYFMFLVFLAIFPVLQCVCLIFHIFPLSLPYSRSSMECVSFLRFIRSLTIFQVLECFSMFYSFLYVPDPPVCVSYFPRYSVFSPYSRSYLVYFSFSMVFRVFFLPYSMSNRVHFSCSSLVSFLAIFQVLLGVFSCFLFFFFFFSVFQFLQCVILIFQVFWFSH